MRNGLLLVGVAFAVTFAIVVGNRLSDQAMAVVVGALCGITASIPVSVAFVIAASRHWGQDSSNSRNLASVERRYGDEYAYRQPQPPVIVIAPPQQSPSAFTAPPGEYYTPPNAPPPGAPRDFKIIGDE